MIEQTFNLKRNNGDKLRTCRWVVSIHMKKALFSSIIKGLKLAYHNLLARDNPLLTLFLKHRFQMFLLPKLVAKFVVFTLNCFLKFTVIV
jgi:hypothetical protein